MAFLVVIRTTMARSTSNARKSLPKKASKPVKKDDIKEEVKSTRVSRRVSQKRTYTESSDSDTDALSVDSPPRKQQHQKPSPKKVTKKVKFATKYDKALQSTISLPRPLTTDEGDPVHGGGWIVRGLF